jgi:hypothetical protein
MAFKLRIRFVGLCFFQPRPGDGYLHVLLPKTPTRGDGGKGGDHDHDDRQEPDAADGAGSRAPLVSCMADPNKIGEHQVILLYHPAYALRNDPNCSDSITDPKQPAKPCSVDLSATPRALVLPGSGTGIPSLPLGVLNLRDVFNEPTRPELYANPMGNPHADLAGRVSLQAAGKFTDRKPGAWWEIKGPGAEHDEAEMAPIMEYVIKDVPGQTLKWDVFPANASPPVPELQPSGGQIELYVYHGPPGEAPKQVPLQLHEAEAQREPGCAWHVAAFYPLLQDQGTGAKPIPRLKRHPNGDPSRGRGAKTTPGPGPKSVSVYTCMSGGAEP